MPRKIHRVPLALLDRLAETSLSSLKVYTALIRLAGRRAPWCEATYREISQEAKVARTTVIASIRALQDVGLVSVERRPDPDVGHKPNLYLIAMDQPEPKALAGECQNSGNNDRDLPGRVE